MQSLLNSSRETSSQLEASLFTEVEARHRDRAEAHIASQALQEKLGQAERSLQMVELRLRDMEINEDKQSIRVAGAEEVEALLARIEVLEAAQRTTKCKEPQFQESITSVLPTERSADKNVLLMEGVDPSTPIKLSLTLMEINPEKEVTTKQRTKQTRIDELGDYQQEIDQLQERLQANDDQLFAKDEVIRAMCTEAEDMKESLESLLRHNHELQQALIQQQAVTREAMEDVTKEHDAAISKLTSDIIEYTKEAALLPINEATENPFARLVTVIEAICIQYTEVTESRHLPIFDLVNNGLLMNVALRPRAVHEDTEWFLYRSNASTAGDSHRFRKF